MTRRVIDAPESLARLRDAARRLGRDVRFMEVCGTHTVACFRSGLHDLLPDNVRLVSGPGCPVCVTAQSDIDAAVGAAARDGVTVCTYGDMLRVPGSGRSSLESARSRGADVRVVYSILDAVRMAADAPRRDVVFVAVGFETTAPATAVAVLEARTRGLKNFSVLASHKRVVPAMTTLLRDRRAGLDGFVCPGHVAVIVGAEAFRPVVDRHGVPCVVTGFEAGQIAAALARLCELSAAGTPALENLYPQAVRADGNRHALRLIDEVFRPADVRWRGLGTLGDSGLELRDEFADFDARIRHRLSATDVPEPPGCRCAEVITARATPVECALFGTTCTPVFPIGPCMVSSEGTCQAWFRYRQTTSPRQAAGSRA